MADQDVAGLMIRLEATTQQMRRELGIADKAVAAASGKIDKQLSEVDKAFDRMGISAGRSGDAISASVAGITAAAGAAAAGIIALASRTASSARQMETFAKLANATTTEFQRMSAGSRTVGIEQDKLADILKDVNDRVGDFLSTGGGEMKDFFEQIAPRVGVTAEQFRKLSGPQSLQLFYSSLEKANLSQAEMTFYMEAMANDATALIPLLKNGGAAFQQMGDRAERMGAVLSQIDLASLAEFSQFADDAKLSLDGLGQQLAVSLLPTIRELSSALEGEGMVEAARAVADGINLIVTNLDVLAATVGGLGAGFLALKFINGANAVRGYVTAVTAATAADSANAAASLAAAQAESRRAAATVLAAQQQAAAAKGTAAYTAALSQLRLAKLGVVEASTREAAAQKAVNAVGSATGNILRGTLSLLGGPVGIAALVGTAAAGWLLYSDNSDDARKATEGLARDMGELRKEIEGLTLAQANNRLHEMTEAQRTLQSALNETTSDLGANFVQLDKWGNKFTVGQKERTEAWNNFLRAIKNGADIGEAANRLADVTGASEEMRAEIVSATAQMEIQAGQAGKNAELVTVLKNTIAALTGETRANTVAKQENNNANAAGLAAGEQYLKQLETQLNRMKDKTAVQAAERVLTDNQIDRQSELGQKILATAAAQDAQREADAKLTGSIKTGNKALDDRIKAIDALRDKYNPAAKAQAEYDAAIRLADESLKDGTYTTEQYQKVVQGLYTDLNKPIWDKHNKQAKEAADAIKKIDDQLEAVRDRLDPVRAATKRLTAEKKLLKEGLDAGSMSLEEYQLRLQQLDDEYKENTRATSEWAKWTEGALDRVDGAFADAWRNIGDGFSSFRDSLTNAFKQMLAELAHLAITRPIVMQIGAALGIGGGAGQAVSMLGGSAGSGGMDVFGLLKNGYSIANSGFGQAVAQGWGNGGFSGAISNGWNYGSNALGGFFGSGAANSGGSAIADYTGAQFGNWVGAQNAAATTWGGAATGLGSIMGGLSGAYMGYQRAGVKGAVAGGLGGWGGGTLGTMAGAAAASALSGTAMGAALGSVLPGIGTVIGAALGAAFGSKLFGGAWETKDAGLAFSVTDGDFLGQQYEYQKKKGGLFSSNKKRTRFSALDDETAAKFQSAFDATEDTVAGLFEALSLSVEEGSLDGLQLARTKISTKGKTEEEIQQAIAEWFGTAADAMTAELQSVFGTGLDLDFAGMQQFVGNLKGVNEVIRYLNVGMYDASVSGGKLAEALSAAAGGLDALAANSATYYGAFFSEAEKIEDTIDSIKRAFESADVELAASREAYRAMVEDIDLTTEAGQKMFATLMALSGQAAQYFSIVEQQAAQKAAEAAALLMGTVNTAYAALQRSIAAQQREIQASASKAAGNISALTGIGNSLDAALKKLRGASDDTVRSLRAQAVMTLNSALVQARSGQSLAGVEGLQDALDTASQMDTALYGSLADFEREQGRTANLIAELEKVNGKQLSVEEKLLKQYEAQLSKLDQELLFAQAQLDALNGVDASVMSVAEAIKAMNASVVAALSLMGGDTGKNATPQNVGTLAESVYRSVLGRQADAAGLAYWQQQVASGAIRLDQLEQAIKNAARANGEIPAFARGGFHSGGLRLVGENGPELEVTGPSRIYNASQTAAMLGGGGDAAAEVRALRNDFAGMTNALRSVAKHTMQTAKRVEFLEHWDFDGLPKERGAA